MTKKYINLFLKMSASLLIVLFFWKLEQYSLRQICDRCNSGLFIFVLFPLADAFLYILPVFIFLKIWKGSVCLEFSNKKTVLYNIFNSWLLFVFYTCLEEGYSFIPAEMHLPYPVFIMFMLRILGYVMMIYIWAPSVFRKYERWMQLGYFLPIFIYVAILCVGETIDTSHPDPNYNEPILRRFCEKHLQYESFFTPLPAHCEKRLKQNADTAPETTQESKPQEMHE